MNLLNSISKKIMLGYSAILLALLITILILFNYTSSLNNSNDYLTKVVLPELEQVEEINQKLAELKLLAFSLYGLTIELDEFNAQSRDIKASIKAALTKVEETQTEEAKLIEEKLTTFHENYDSLSNTMSSDDID